VRIAETEHGMLNSIGLQGPGIDRFPPATWDLASVALAVQAAGADGLTLVNTMRGMSIDAHTLRPRLATATGGYSGPALKPIALAAVWTCYRATRMPIVGMGGIASGADAIEFVAAGASVVGVGTALFADPESPSRIRAELAREIARKGFTSVAEIVGSAHGESLSTLTTKTHATAAKS
jgi:dihydroorotate dehydrogenase (NAD+) catalytic subunit